MGDQKRKQNYGRELYVSLMGEIDLAVARFRERRNTEPTRLFLGKVEAGVLGLHMGKVDPHGKTLYLEKSGISLPVWVMKSAHSAVDVG